MNGYVSRGTPCTLLRRFFVKDAAGVHAVKRSGTKCIPAGDGLIWRTFLNRADSPGATKHPLWLDHLGGTRAPASWPRSRPRGEFAPETFFDCRAPVQGSVKIAVAHMREQGNIHD